MKRQKKRKKIVYKCVIELNFASINSLGKPRIVVPYWSFYFCCRRCTSTLAAMGGSRALGPQEMRPPS
jgi:hypothetical protein